VRAVTKMGPEQINRKRTDRLEEALDNEGNISSRPDEAEKSVHGFLDRSRTNSRDTFPYEPCHARRVPYLRPQVIWQRRYLPCMHMPAFLVGFGPVC
jgi:hypothetical protein